MLSTILVTGGAGYIGSHAVVKLLQNNYSVIILDNLSNSSPKVLQRIEQLTNKQPIFIKGDILDSTLLHKLFQQYSIDAVMHFAGLKSVAESTSNPLAYYHNNVSGSNTLLRAMNQAGVKKIIFSSSATVYGTAQALPMTEQHPLQAVNPYGGSKLIIEQMLTDLSNADSQWNIAILRYFNPVGAHPSGLLGEQPTGIPNNLMPYICKVATHELPKLKVFGNDYPTVDGTGVRDYIHVEDLVEGHLNALQYLEQEPSEREHLEQEYSEHIHPKQRQCLKVNLGVGKGFSVLQLVDTFMQANQLTIPYEIVEKRPGDIAECYASTTLAQQTLKWKAKKTIEEMCIDAWRWQSNNPQGYETA